MQTHTAVSAHRQAGRAPFLQLPAVTKGNRPYLTVYFSTASDFAQHSPARFGHACSHAKAATAAAKRLLNGDFAIALIYSPARIQLTHLQRSKNAITLQGDLP